MSKGRTHLAAWVTQETKERFRAFAQGLGLSESSLLRRAVELMLRGTDASGLAKPATASGLPRDLRISVRLRADDCRLLAERARARGIPTATYASMVLRSHLQGVVPLPDRELAELNRSVSALSMVGSNLNQLARVANLTGQVDSSLMENLRALMRVVQALRDHFKALLHANAKSWETGHDGQNR